MLKSEKVRQNIYMGGCLMDGIKIIGIAGGTGSGKSTLAHKIKEQLRDEITLICHDNYYKDGSDMPFNERVKRNYDHPDAFDTDLFLTHLKMLKEGKEIDMPTYSFIEHTRNKETIHIVPAQVILVEGILIFENEELRKMMDMKIFVDTDADVRFIRRMVRDVKERGRDLDSVVNQYLNTVKPMHEQFVEPSKKFADVIVPEGGYNLVALEMINERLKRMVEK